MSAPLSPPHSPSAESSSTPRVQRITPPRRSYNQWVANETMEDYALRFTASRARRWSAFRVANTAFGAISFLACEAIGGTITLTFGFSNAMAAILAVGVLMFALGLPICLSATRHGVDVDLLTRGAGFGYIGSTITSLIYASFTFILFAIEASIMSDAITLVLGAPLWLANLVSAVVVVPIAAFGIRAISRVQIWTQPIWLALQFGPLLVFALGHHDSLRGWFHFTGSPVWGRPGMQEFGLLPFGMAASVLLSLLPQIGEQVDYLRFLPERREIGPVRWWSALLIAGPGWVLVGCAKLAIGSFLAYLALTSGGVPAAQAAQPATAYLLAFGRIFHDPVLAAVLALVFVVTCQVKINVTNAYAGSLAWSNFFSRLTHSHPGRVVWMVFNVLLALLLMEIGIYRVIGSILGLYANFAIGWMGALAADLLINKPLGLSPKGIEFKRAHLPGINPVGVGAMGLSVLASTMMSFGLFGPTLHALAPFAGLAVALIAAPVIAFATGGRTYLARASTFLQPHTHAPQERCTVCENSFERPDMAICPVYGGAICSLCCSLDARCHDRCKNPAATATGLGTALSRLLPQRLTRAMDRRVGSFLVVFALFTLSLGALLLVIGFEYAAIAPQSADIIRTTLWVVFLALFIISGVVSWLLVLAQASRRAAEEESERQTGMLMEEISAHERTDAALQTAKEAAEAANTAKSRYMVGVIHEIRAPLNAIFGYAQLMERAGTVRPTDAARIIRGSAEHLSNLVDGLLDISKIESGSLQLHRDRVNLAELLDQIGDMFRLQAAAKGLAFIDDRPATLPRFVYSDEKRLRQILLNLLANAVKYTESGHVRLSLRFRSQVAEFEIEDTGCGIRPEDLGKIFEPFERGAMPASRAVPGTGLGLTISKLLVTILGGEISVESTPGQGSRFRLRLLLSEAPAEPEDARTERRIGGYGGRRRTILLVDDDPAHVELMREILEPLGFVLFTAADGASGLTLAAQCRPDLAILDVSMPGLSGWEVAAALRQSPPATGGERLRILMVSGNLHEIPTGSEAPSDHDAFLAKPIDIRALLEAIRDLLRLEWTDEAPPPALPPPAPPVSRPDPATWPRPARRHLSDLLELARIGYVRGLEAKLAEIRSDPQFVPFAEHLGGLVRDFALRQVTALLEQWLEEDDAGA